MADPMIIKVENKKINIITEENPIILKQTGQGMPGRDGATPEWGHITGDISDQADLWSDLSGKTSEAPLDGAQYARKDGTWTDLAPTLNDKADIILSSASGSVVTISDGAPLPVSALSIGIEAVQSGSGDPAPDNVRPITGWSTAKLMRTGTNLLNAAALTWTDAIRGDDGTSTASTSSHYCSEIAVKPNTTYTLSGDLRTSSSTYRVYFLDMSKGWISRTGSQSGDSYTFTTASNCGYIQIQVTAVRDLTSAQLEIGSTATAYQPYTDTTVTIALGDTIYGGTLNVLTGELTVTHAIIDLSTLGWERAEGTGGVYVFQAVVSDKALGVTNMICSDYATTTVTAWNSNKPNNSICGSTSNRRFVIRDTRYTTASAFTTAVSGVKAVYELDTPTTVQLTENQLSTLKGGNVLWADCGATSITYRADTKLFIERLTQPDDDMIADANIASGKFFMVGNSLYLSSQSIASGDTIVPGTNCTQLSLADALNNINS